MTREVFLKLILAVLAYYATPCLNIYSSITYFEVFTVFNEIFLDVSLAAFTNTNLCIETSTASSVIASSTWKLEFENCNSFEYLPNGGVRYYNQTGTIWIDKWSEGWTNAVVWKLNRVEYILLYKSDPRYVEGNGNNVLISTFDEKQWHDINRRQWRPNWKSLYVFYIHSKPFLLSVREGESHVDEFISHNELQYRSSITKIKANLFVVDGQKFLHYVKDGNVIVENQDTGTIYIEKKFLD